jgi:SAM-dependent methyltransferase
MDIDTVRALFAPAGQRLLAEAEAADLYDAARVRTLTRLRRAAPAALAAAAYETAVLRRRAAAKFGRAPAMYFTRAALEQASGERVAVHRARRFAALDRIVDLGCGIGGDSIAFAAVTRVIGVDRDRVRLLLARANVAAHGRTANAAWVEADIADGGPVRVAGAFVDPGRRTEQGRRVFDPRAYEPPLDRVAGWRGRYDLLAVKVAPGIADADIAALAPDAELEFVADGLDLKEAVLWFGLGAVPGRRATVLPAAATLWADADPAAPVAAAGRWLIEPNAAVIRAHLIGTLARRLDAWQIDATIAYLSTDHPVASPFARAWPVERVLPFGVDAVRRELRSLGVGRVTVKKRGSPLEPEAFIRMLRLDGPHQRTVFLTRQLGRPVAIICGDESL